MATRVKRPAGSRSAGYHYDATPKKPVKTKTPVVAPKPGQAATGPAGDYAGAQKDYEAAVVALPPKAQAVTEAATKRATRAQKRRAKRVSRIVKETKRKPPKAPEPPKYTPPKVADLGSKLGEAVKVVAGLPKTAIKAEKAALSAAAKVPEQKTSRAFGKPTLGTPKVKEVVQAKREGRLSGVHRGKVVATPQARRAKKQLKRARRVYAKKAKPQISGLLNEEQERFAERLSEKTGLPPKLAGDWTLKESGASSAGAGGEAGEQNQLGVGYPAHPTSFSQSGYFNNTTPEKAADATAAWMEGKIGGEYDYQAAPSIQEIPKLAKAGASDAELRAYIAGPSAWGTGEIPDSPQVTATPGKAGPKVTGQLKRAEKQAKKLGIKTKPKVSAESYAAKPAKKRKGEWAGTEDILLKAARGIPISSEKRTPEHNAAIGGSPTSDHLTTNVNAFATDLPTTDGVPIANKVTKRLGISGWTPGNYDWYTTPKYPGYRFQVLWEVEGHYDHVHVGAEWTGEDLPAGTISGGSVAGGGGTATFSPSGGGPAISVPAPPKEVRKGKSVTPAQKVARTKRKLRELGVGESSTTTSHTSDSVLAELEKKYQVA